MLNDNALGAFEILKKACLKAPVLAFADFNKLFLLETDANKQTDGQYHLVAYAGWSLTIHECNYPSTKQEFLALKWAIAEQFQGYLLWKPFTVKTDKNCSPTSWLHPI